MKSIHNTIVKHVPNFLIEAKYVDLYVFSIYEGQAASAS